ncbi:hypothetical protein JBL43_07655 [Aureibaculum sp. A20]|uniref:Lipoprotein n=1 Tax=Aureibaculum flavum TaxID=2795986 RepID=A0ABS0WQ50_9FLAO|nr:hypothetical protein [Aureibaculum flavum]MBJ2174107.1 hypothetical protein [Aureibaculum flavum]
MRNILLILTVITLISCDNKTDKNNNSIIGMQFQNFRQLNQLEKYTKVSDTTIYESNLEPKYGILQLRDNSNNLVIFKSISLDSIRNTTFKILDTLIIPNPNKTELITIGYCQINNDNNENLIALVDKTDSLKIQNIKKIWKANTDSEKIEKVNNLNEINCINEWFVKK